MSKTTKTAPAKPAPLPSKGGSFTRAADGSLKPVQAPVSTPQAEAPATKEKEA